MLKRIISIAMNPSIDKSAGVDRVIVERKLYSKMPAYEAGGGVEHIVPQTAPVISKVGAGDSMVAGIVLSLAKGMSACEAIRFGVAAGTAAVMTPGTELCRREDAERLYQEMTFVST